MRVEGERSFEENSGRTPPKERILKGCGFPWMSVIASAVRGQTSVAVSRRTSHWEMTRSGSRAIVQLNVRIVRTRCTPRRSGKCPRSVTWMAGADPALLSSAPKALVRSLTHGSHDTAEINSRALEKNHSKYRAPCLLATVIPS